MTLPTTKCKLLLEDYTVDQLTEIIRDYVKTNKLVGYTKMNKQAIISQFGSYVETNHNTSASALKYGDKTKKEIISAIQQYNGKYNIAYSDKNKAALIDIIKTNKMVVNVAPKRLLTNKEWYMEVTVPNLKKKYPNLTTKECIQFMNYSALDYEYTLIGESSKEYKALERLSRTRQALKENPPKTRTGMGRYLNHIRFRPEDCNFMEHYFASLKYTFPEEFEEQIAELQLDKYEMYYREVIEKVYRLNPEMYQEDIPIVAISENLLYYGTQAHDRRISIISNSYKEDETFENPIWQNLRYRPMRNF